MTIHPFIKPAISHLKYLILKTIQRVSSTNKEDMRLCRLLYQQPAKRSRHPPESCILTADQPGQSPQKTVLGPAMKGWNQPMGDRIAAWKWSDAEPQGFPTVAPPSQQKICWVIPPSPSILLHSLCVMPTTLSASSWLPPSPNSPSQFLTSTRILRLGKLDCDAVNKLTHFKMSWLLPAASCGPVYWLNC